MEKREGYFGGNGEKTERQGKRKKEGGKHLNKYQTMMHMPTWVIRKTEGEMRGSISMCPRGKNQPHRIQRRERRTMEAWMRGQEERPWGVTSCMEIYK